MMKEGRLIRFLVVALPTGLLILGVGSMLVTHLSSSEQPVDPNEAVRLETAALNQRPVNRDDLSNTLEILCEVIGERHLGVPKNLERAAVWIESRLGPANLGYRVERHVYEVDGTEVRNLIAELPGTAARDEIVVVGAHYDTVPDCPGANDNGSAVAALIALAQAFAGEQQARTVRFVAFVNEEPPYFQTDKMGSRVYARRCREREENIVAMMSLDTIGYFTDTPGTQKSPDGIAMALPSAGNFLAFVGNESSRYLADSARAAFQLNADITGIAGGFPETIPGVGWSDHWSFWQEGFNAIMVTDTAPFRYPHYHLPTDTVDKLDLDTLETVTRGLENVVRVWANP